MENSIQENPQPKLPRKKIFQIVLKNFATIGIDSNLRAQPYPINGKILMSFAILAVTAILTLSYALYGAKTFIECIQSTYMGSAATLIFFELLIVILHMEKLFKLIEDCESIVNTSKNTIESTSYRLCISSV